MSVCLDSWAVIAWLDGEQPATDMVESALDPRPVINWINLAEVFYRVSREHGEPKAIGILNELRMQLDCELPTERRVVEAARVKATHPIALADCFAISAAADNDCVLYTGDPEIISRAADLPCEIRDLR